MAVVIEQGRIARPASTRKGASLRGALRRKSTVAFFLTLPLILLIVDRAAAVVIGRREAKRFPLAMMNSHRWA